jgi:hypothetical protein
MQRPGAVQLASFAPDLTGQRWLGRIGNVAGLTYSDTMPGGNDTLSCTLQMQPGLSDVAIEPGRIIRVYQGARWIWEGNLGKAASDAQGWKLTAKGAGNYGDNYGGLDSGGFASANPCIAAAVGRGLRWINPGVSDTGMFLTQPPDTGSLYVTDWLNQITSGGAYTWHIGPWNTLKVMPIPSTVTRLLVATTPAAPTLNGYYDALYAYYQDTSDTTSTTATHAIAEAENTLNIARHGRIEATWDLSSAGQMSSGDAAAAAAAVLSRYISASFSEPFTVSYGQYLTTGGTPVDLSCERAGEVVRLLLTDGGYGGQVAPAVSITFPVGKVEYDDDHFALQVTPFANIRSDLSSMLSAVATILQPRTTPGG